MTRVSPEELDREGITEDMIASRDGPRIRAVVIAVMVQNGVEFDDN